MNPILLINENQLQQIKSDEISIMSIRDSEDTKWISLMINYKNNLCPLSCFISYSNNTFAITYLTDEYYSNKLKKYKSQVINKINNKIVPILKEISQNNNTLRTLYVSGVLKVYLNDKEETLFAC